MSNRSIEQYRDILRRDFYAFLHRSFLELNPHTRFLPAPYLEALAAHLERVRRGEIRRLIINMPPRSLKSHCASIAFPAWLLGHNPSAQILAVSYGQDLADRLARECRSLMTSRFYEALFPTRLSPQKQATAEFETTKKGYRLSSSVGGALTGRGADFLIVDDPLKPDEAVSELRREAVNDWYNNTLYTRLNSKATGAIVIIMQRLHDDDLVGHVLGQEPWTVLSFPAIAKAEEVHRIETPYGSFTFRRNEGEVLNPDHEPRETLEQIRKAVGTYNFAGQYQQTPAPLGDSMVKEEWFKRYDQPPASFDQIIQSWDTASGAAELNSYSVCTTWGIKEKQAYLLHVLRERLEYPNLKRAVQHQAKTFGAQVVIIEKKGSGISLLQDLAAAGLAGITAFEPQQDKMMRMHAQTAFIENGLAHLPRAAPWLDSYLYELVTFPKGKYNDQVDSTSQAIAWIKGKQDSAQGWVDYYRSLAEEARRQRLSPDDALPPLAMATLRAPQPFSNYYVSGVNGRGGIYRADGDGIIENVHPEDVKILLRQGCKQV